MCDFYWDCVAVVWTGNMPLLLCCNSNLVMPAGSQMHHIWMLLGTIIGWHCCHYDESCMHGGDHQNIVNMREVCSVLGAHNLYYLSSFCVQVGIYQKDEVVGMSSELTIHLPTVMQGQAISEAALVLYSSYFSCLHKVTRMNSFSNRW